MRIYKALAGLAVCALSAQMLSGPQVLTYFSQVDDTDQPYAIYLPKSIEPGRKYPLVISLHGLRSNHRLNLRRVFGFTNRISETDAEAARYFPSFPDLNWIVASPFLRGNLPYDRLGERDVYAVLDDVRKRFLIDENRIYLTGLSTGGGGALAFAFERPDIWAAVAAICPIAPSGIEKLAGNATHIPIKLYQGDLDPIVPVAQTREWHKRLLEAGVPAEYVEYSGVRHNSWERAYQNAGVFRWFEPFQRTRNPAHVTFQTSRYLHSKAYWTQIDALTPGTEASIDAKVESRNRLTVTTTAIDGLTLTPPGVVRPASIVVDGKTIPWRGAGAIHLRKTAKGWALGKYARTPEEKAPGLEGPLGAAISDRHIYVYGTADQPSPEELGRRQRTANEAATWSTLQTPVRISLRVLADREVSPEDLASSNLILFGDRRTNSVVAKVDPNPLMELNPGAADYGLVYLTHARGRYIVVNSGLPWWTRADQTQRGALEPFRLLETFSDYILFRGGLDGVLAEGDFDRWWRLTPADRKKLEATGALKVRP